MVVVGRSQLFDGMCFYGAVVWFRMFGDGCCFLFFGDSSGFLPGCVRVFLLFFVVGVVFCCFGLCCRVFFLAVHVVSFVSG